MKDKLFLILGIFLLCGCSNYSKKENLTTPQMTYSLTNIHMHDSTAFTEGLFFFNNKIYESTGSPEDFSNTGSVFGSIDLKKGVLNKIIELDKTKYFGEGSVVLNGKVFLLTYTSKIGFVYDFSTLEKVAEFKLPGKEGWGLTTDGIHLIMSDGSSRLWFIDPNTFEIVRQIDVTDGKGPVLNINELELAHGAIYANVFLTNKVIKIDSSSGKVIGEIDLDPLAQDAKIAYPGSMEMNGIAYDEQTDRFVVTGKMWPYLYEIRIK
ncbi:glutaminyl-peptide cyclotransferase [Danxiaibacter flavus]|uniref:Glutaminyl-peptide cyclotransferase n=1 Tax=Danxiaibacter flavus TaxID=3049108 RepID=A0ABV3ZDP0_9BACT|nr:glutaminyl-peptide cyclotransferase [Chitinophagaceae bacterium DXS]